MRWVPFAMMVVSLFLLPLIIVAVADWDLVYHLLFKGGQINVGNCVLAFVLFVGGALRYKLTLEEQEEALREELSRERREESRLERIAFRLKMEEEREARREKEREASRHSWYQTKAGARITEIRMAQARNPRRKKSGRTTPNLKGL